MMHRLWLLMIHPGTASGRGCDIRDYAAITAEEVPTTCCQGTNATRFSSARGPGAAQS
jgi:hypothetical protein